MIYFTSDTHFMLNKHPGRLQVGDRAFRSIEERDAFLLSRWNEAVGPDDEIYILGDFSEGDGRQTGKLLTHLHGIKYLVAGNNDLYLDDPAFPKDSFAWCRQYYELHALGTKFVLFHYPIEAWSGYTKDRVHLHGHIHRKQPLCEPIRRYDVGVDAHDGRPVSIEAVWAAVKDRHNEDRRMPF